MPRYIVERQYLVPLYEHILVEARDFETACRRALDEIDEPWGDSVETDYESARPTMIERAVEVPASIDVAAESLSHPLYSAGLEPLDIPDEFAEESDGADSAVGFV